MRKAGRWGPKWRHPGSMKGGARAAEELPPASTWQWLMSIRLYSMMKGRCMPRLSVKAKATWRRRQRLLVPAFLALSMLQRD